MAAEEKPRPPRPEQVARREDVGVKASPLRCPFCHADVAKDGAGWVACASCLARHHDACWGEGGRCGACGHERPLEPREAPAPPPAVRSAGVSRRARLLAVGLGLVVAALTAAGVSLPERPEQPLPVGVAPSSEPRRVEGFSPGCLGIDDGRQQWVVAHAPGSRGGASPGLVFGQGCSLAHLDELGPVFMRGSTGNRVEVGPNELVLVECEGGEIRFRRAVLGPVYAERLAAIVHGTPTGELGIAKLRAQAMALAAGAEWREE